MDRYQRQQKLVPLDKLKDVLVEVVGVGAVGRQIAIQLAAMGVPIIRITDFDTVEEVNLAPQGFRERDLGRPKVDAVSETMKENNSKVEILTRNRRFAKSQAQPGSIIFSCVDDMDVRKRIFEASKEARMFIDGRMSAEVLRIFAAHNKQSREYYQTTLFPQEEAFVGSCTARSTIYSANVLAGMKIAMMTRWLRGLPIENEVSLNLMTMEFGVH